MKGWLDTSEPNGNLPMALIICPQPIRKHYGKFLFKFDSTAQSTEIDSY